MRSSHLRSSPPEIARALAESPGAGVAALAHGARRPDIPWSWNVTSDSLAAWLAGELPASRLVLVKHEAARMDR